MGEPQPAAGQPLSIAEGAVGLHELFTSLVNAGFTENQALYLVGQAMRGAGGSAGTPPVTPAPRRLGHG